MNREIKFRAWDNEAKRMMEFDFESIHGGKLIFVNSRNNEKHFDLEEMTIMQYTGLKDRNGKEIYDGDVVRIYYPPEIGSAKGLTVNPIQWVGVVAWENESKRWDYSGVGFNIASDEIIEVIGNVFEHPELVNK
jgi:uncharacterized phage protein (TIGR01671 family)